MLKTGLTIVATMYTNLRIALRFPYIAVDALKRRAISGDSSIFLDGMRLLAALVVLVWHASYQWLPGYPRLLAIFDDLSHAAVIVFFVLFGYLITYTTTNNNRGPR